MFSISLQATGACSRDSFLYKSCFIFQMNTEKHFAYLKAPCRRKTLNYRANMSVKLWVAVAQVVAPVTY